MKYKAIIFDLDGTLTYTLVDLMNSTNYALKSMGWPERSLDEVRRFVGNGVRRLMLQAVPEGVSESDFERCFDVFKKHYVVHCQDNTCLYAGIESLLCRLKEAGVRMGIVSNKLQAGVDELYNRYFTDTVEVAIGEHEGVQRKPDADMVELALSRLGVDKSDAVYVGDSEVDVLTARNSGMPCVSVLWGFRDREWLEAYGADVFASSADELFEIVSNA